MSAATTAPGTLSAERSARPFLRSLGAAAVVLLGLLASSAPASASTDEESVLRYAQTITLDGDGQALVELELTQDFGDLGRHGPELYLVDRIGYDDAQDREYLIGGVTASSSDAPAQVHLEDLGSRLRIRIGDPDTEISGVHTYRITYRVDGWVNPAGFAFPSGTLAQDELYLNVIDEGWSLPLQDISVTVVGPADATAVECFAGPTGSTTPCDGVPAPGPSVTVTQSALDPGDPLTLAVGFPAGTFDTAPLLVERAVERSPFALTPLTGGLAALVAGVGSFLVLRRARRVGRDEVYLGLTPGLSPVPGADGTTTARGSRSRHPVAVRFTPPEGLRPGQLGTLVDEKADTHDVTSTIVDLAVRGFVLIERLSDPEEDWRLIWTGKEPVRLLPYEDVLVTQIFRGQQSTTLSELRTTFASDLKRVQGLLYEDVTDRGWFRSNPQTARGRWAGGGVGLVVLGGLLTAALAQFSSFALVGLGLVVVGVVTLATAGLAPARTAAGSAVLAQTEGFRLYLATAEAEQLRFEEGEDLFSRYLPFAIAFGLTERWARVFAELAARGEDLPTPSWYLGSWGHAGFWASAGTLDRDLAGFTSAADSAVSAPTPGSSGSSGLGGGGFSGGGGGGGGGGSW
ncbi:DUF2207 domain-containing protein [Actinotalea sp.]|uniref:DUF2207 domain-containing protein n=1 Tax=Actinotalea sp. TaxID=1872145 RepID=UPI003565AABC